VDAAISRLAARQDGVVHCQQLFEIGVTEDGIQWRLGARLHRIHRGVYAVGHTRLTREGRWRAAVFAAGASAVLSHESAAALLELRLGKERDIEVTAPTRRRGHQGVRVHRSEIPDGDVWQRRGIPVTSPVRTILDLAHRLHQNALEKLIREAEYRQLTTPAALTSRLETKAPSRGSRSLRAALSLATETRGNTRSPLEDDFLAFLRKHGLALPQLNATLELEGSLIEPDCLWREQRVIVELDGGGAHRTQHGFHADRARDLALQAAGWKAVRVTSPRIKKDGTKLASQLRKLLDG
jgi:very-short-patch-repair endonuclease